MSTFCTGQAKLVLAIFIYVRDTGNVCVIISLVLDRSPLFVRIRIEACRLGKAKNSKKEKVRHAIGHMYTAKPVMLFKLMKMSSI